MNIQALKAIKSILDIAQDKKESSFEVPDAHQKPVLDCFKKISNKPERLID